MRSRKYVIPLALVVAVAVGLGLALAAVTAASETVRLQADLSREFVVWEGNHVISYHYDGSAWTQSTPGLVIYFDEQDEQVLRGFGEQAYIVIHYIAADGEKGRELVPLKVAAPNVPTTYITVFTGNVWSVTYPSERYVTALIPLKQILDAGSIAIDIDTSVKPTSADDVSIRITKVGIAPVKTVNNESNGKVGDEREPLFWGFMFDVKKYILIGAGIIGICIIIAAVVVRSLGR